MRKDEWFVYVIRCADGSLYCGVATDVDARVRAHGTGRGARYTRGRGPLELLGCAGPFHRGVALSLEARFKRLRRSEKLMFSKEIAGLEPFTNERWGNH